MAFFLGLVALALVLMISRALKRLAPGTGRKILRLAGGFVALAAGTLLILRGGAVIGGPLAALGAMLLGLNQVPGFPYTAGQTQPHQSENGGEGAAKTGQQSEVKTRWFEMRLDHDSGHMDGIVLQGQYLGKLLSELEVGTLVALLPVCERDDPPSGQLLSAYLDWREPHWREQAASESGAQGASGAASGSSSGSPSSRPSGPMSREQALAILGLESNASRDEIRKAHRHLMRHVHPDHGGSSYLAAQINAAKDVLLGESDT